MKRKIWLAPAKLNLFLHVLGRRADGYHQLQTLFQFLSFADRLSFDLRNDGQVRRLGEIRGVSQSEDLCVRAALLLKEYAQEQQGADIHIEKRLPMGGGLGGGSSDAATVLVALNELWKVGLGLDELAKLGLRLGADVPVFVLGKSAWAEGVGEELNVVSIDQPWYLVVIPPVQVSTAEIFAAPELTRDTKPITIAAFQMGVGRNDCEPVVRKRYHEVAEALDWLSEYGPARMTGTGACVFLAFDSEADARAVEHELPTGWNCFVAQGCNQSPMRG